MTTEPIKARLKLTVTNVKPAEEKQGTKGPYKILKFQAKNEQGQENWYSSFRSSVFDAIKPGETIDAEVETKETPRKDGTGTFIDHNVLQIFVDGQPLGGQKQGGGYAGRPYQGKSPEERISIERQKSLDLAIQRAKPTDTDDQVLARAEKFFGWIHGDKGAVVSLPKAKPEELEKVFPRSPTPPVAPPTSGPRY